MDVLRRCTWISTPTALKRTQPRSGDPETGEPVPDPDCDCPECLNWLHNRWIWNLELVRTLAADRQEPVTFFCGGTRNFAKFSDLFDAVFVLHVDLDTLQQRLEQRPEDEFGGKQSDRDFVARVYPTSEGLPDQGIMINSGRPVTDVVDEILRHVNDASDRHRAESTDAEPRRGPAVHPADHPAGEQRVGEVDRRGSDLLDRGVDVIIEGILNAAWYTDMLVRLVADHRGGSRSYIWKLPFDETVRRTATKPATRSSWERDLRRWWRGAEDGSRGPSLSSAFRTADTRTGGPCPGCRTGACRGLQRNSDAGCSAP